MMKDTPKPRMPEIAVDKTMAHGTAVAAFEASSEICTAESNEPEVDYLPETATVTDEENTNI